MGQFDNLKSFEPVNITPQGATGNPLSFYEQRPVKPGYPSPEQIAGNYWQMGPFSPAGVYEINGQEFLQSRLNWASVMSNVQIVSVPERPVDRGTFQGFGGTPRNGVYNQPMQTGTTKQFAGSAPTTGVYTGFYTSNGEYEGGC